MARQGRAGRALILAAAALLLAVAGARAAWLIETVAPLGGLAGPPDLAFDAAGWPHVAYVPATNRKITYAARGPGSWTVWPDIDGGPSSGITTPVLHLGSLAGDILLTRVWYASSMYARVYQGGIFQSYPPLDGMGRAVTGIAADGSGELIYLVGDNWSSSPTSQWGFHAMRRVDSATVSLAPIAVPMPSQARPVGTVDLTLRADGQAVIDSAGQLHVIQYYEIGLTGYLLYAVGPTNGPFSVDVNADMGWTIKTGRPSIAVDSQNRPHIAYTALWPVYGVRYAVLTSVGWSSETIEAGGNERALVGTCPDVLIDSAGTVHVIYADGKRGLLRHATKGTGGAWQIETIDTIGVQQAGADPANGLPGALGARMDAAGGIGVAYWDADDGVLKYAYLPGP